MIRTAVLFHDLHELGCQQLRTLLCFRMRSENDGVAGLQRKHAVAHRRHDRIRDWRDSTDHTHRLRDQDEIAFFLFADDAAGFLVLQIVPDDAGLALVLQNLVFVDTDTCLVDGLPGQWLGIVVHVLRDIANDRVDLLLGERFEDSLGFPGLRDQFYDFVIRHFTLCSAHAYHPGMSCCLTGTAIISHLGDAGPAGP